MKILYYSTPFFADCDFPLVKALQEEGHDVTYLIALAPYSLKSTLFNIKKQVQENAIIPATCYPELKVYENYMDMTNVYIVNRTVKQNSSLQALMMTVKVVQFIRKGKFDIIHTDCMLGMWELMLYKLFRKKMVLTVHDPFMHSGEVSILEKINYRIAARNVPAFVLLNKQQSKQFCSTYHLNSNQILNNRLGVYDNVVSFVKSDATVKKKNVLFFGRISPYKGLEYLCKAMVKVKEQVPDATLTIAGGGKIYFDISSYEKKEWVKIINRYVGMEELASLLQNCSLTVCPYTDATQSGVIMTSYSLCKPVIATNVGGLGEMVEDGKTGLLVPPKNIDALANAIISLLNDEDTLNQMAKDIKNDYFVGEKSWKVIAEKYIQFYKTIV